MTDIQSGIETYCLDCGGTGEEKQNMNKQKREGGSKWLSAAIMLKEFFEQNRRATELMEKMCDD